MQRRYFLSLFAATAGAEFPRGGCALLMDVETRKLLAMHGSESARRWLAPPGSTIKPFTLLALLDAGKLEFDESFPCPGRLTLNGHSLNCSHPYVAVPMNAARAIAYSCNCSVAHFAARFENRELSRYLHRAGISGASPLPFGPATQLQAIGEAGISLSALDLLDAYRWLALRASEPQLSPILEGLEGAVEFGTAQAARLNHIAVAGKTGSVLTNSGARVAWFAGLAPSRAPKVAAVVMVQGRSGGADAAPIAGQLLRNYFSARA